MKLLLDQNLSHKLATALVDVFPHISHVRSHLLQASDDAIVWEFARANGYVIVPKDDDFHQRSFLYGHPPKVVWLRLGNCSTKQIESLMRWNATKLSAFAIDPIASVLILP